MKSKKTTVSFQRTRGERRYRKVFVIASEGSKTEPRYFGLFNRADSVILVKCLGATHKNAPRQVLKTMSRHLKKVGLGASDEAWIVVDKDQWSEDDLAQLLEWSRSDTRYGLAVSNPKFEYWLLIHFENGGGVGSSAQCSKRLAKHLPGYDKSIDTRKFELTKVEEAIKRAKRRDTPPCSDWPHAVGTTVYRLVENILKS